MRPRWAPPKALATPDDLAAEPEDAKALRLLRSLRHFVASRYGVTCIEIDGHALFIVKHDTRRHPATMDTTPAAVA